MDNKWGRKMDRDNDRWAHRWCMHRDGAKRRNEAVDESQNCPYPIAFSSSMTFLFHY